MMMAAREKYDEAMVVEQLHDPKLCKTAFGKVIEGLDIVDKIASVKTGRMGWFDDVPKTPVVIDCMERIEEN